MSLRPGIIRLLYNKERNNIRHGKSLTTCRHVSFSRGALLLWVGSLCCVVLFVIVFCGCELWPFSFYNGVLISDFVTPSGLQFLVTGHMFTLIRYVWKEKCQRTPLWVAYQEVSEHQAISFPGLWHSSIRMKTSPCSLEPG